MSNDQLKFECKFAMYSQSKFGKSDILFVKENIVQPNGDRTPNTRILKDMPRDYYLTREAFRDHNDKKDYEELKKLQKFSTPQWNLANHISRSLGNGATSLPLKQICRSPYVYGADIEPTSLIKARYEEQFPDVNMSAYSVSVIDIETDVVNEEFKNQPLMCTLSFKDRSYTFVVRRFFPGEDDETIIRKLHECAHKHIGEVIQARNLKMEFELVDHPADGFVKLFARAHEWKPDWMTGWNSLDFDYQVITNCLEMAGVNPEDVYCDPSVPKEYRNVKYFQGKTHQVKNDGIKETKRPLANYEKWPYVNAPASFRWADSMCAYYYLRTAKGKELNYKLDNIANKVLDGIGKLAFKEAEGYHGLDLHELMQTTYKYEYVVYNLFDCIVVEMMDEVTNDLSMAVPAFCGVSDYRSFTSQPTRIAEAMHYDVIKEGYVWGTTSDKMRTDLDDNLQGLGGWIVMLPTELVANNGKAMFKELPNVLSYVRTSTNDIDVEGAYPSGTVIMNVGKQTTWIEMTKIEGLDDTQYRQVAVNLAAGGFNNAGELARMVYQAPNLATLAQSYAEENNLEFNYLDAA